MEKRESSCTVGGNADWCSHCGKQFGDSSKKFKNLPYDPVIPLLSIYLKKTKTLTGKNLCTPAGNGQDNRSNLDRRISIDKWIKRVWYIYTVEY